MHACNVGRQEESNFKFTFKAVNTSHGANFKTQKNRNNWIICLTICVYAVWIPIWISVKHIKISCKKVSEKIVKNWMYSSEVQLKNVTTIKVKNNHI